MIFTLSEWLVVRASRTKRVEGYALRTGVRSQENNVHNIKLNVKNETGG